ncbi:phosphomannomutase/phosphoglucomutase [Thioalkalivibrio sp. HK1]|uniref:phosphomannomutase/phosphoglucomutase n=1 Tax=Thioalkalivibrio sp. HK1 TaxID=1469245 RepID=UPI0004706297|nr:phosphomannomutase/phosphoglucomutase [Thioalkalivibrio sp. HK1]
MEDEMVAPGDMPSNACADRPDEDIAYGGGIESSAGENRPLPRAIFRAYDIRGIVGQELTEEVVYRIAQAIGVRSRALDIRTLVVGRDGRHSGPMLGDALIRGLNAGGCDVLDIGLVPSPLLYFATSHLGTKSGVMVTGSHNPSSYNGLKILLKGQTLYGDDIIGLKYLIESGDIERIVDERKAASARRERIEGMERIYIERVLEDIAPVSPTSERALKIVIDCGNGAAGSLAPALFRALGHEVIELHCEIDGDFPNHHPDPTVPENLEDLIRTVRERRADLGLAFDGDGDRLGVVDDRGGILWPDRQLMLYARDVLSNRPGERIIFDVKCTGLLAAYIEQYKGRPVMCRSGHSYIKRELLETAAPLAGEMSGHIFFADRWLGFDDALYAGARMAEILGAAGCRASELFAQLPDGVGTPEIRVPVAEGEQERIVEMLKSGNAFPDAQITEIDGLRADFSDGWGLVRASNTEPGLVMRFEGKDAQSLARIRGRFEKALLATAAGPMLEDALGRLASSPTDLAGHSIDTDKA